jgi:hypothetical protein
MKTKSGKKRKVAELEAENKALRAEVKRLKEVRYELLTVKTKEGLLASEWIMRVAKTEAEVKRLKKAITTIRDHQKLVAGSGYKMSTIYAMANQALTAIPKKDPSK